MSKFEKVIFEKVIDDAISAEQQARYTMRNTESRSDPWIPASQRAFFSEYAVALIELVGNDKANELMGEAVITELGKDVCNALRRAWASTDASWIDMCREALRGAGKEVP